MYKKQQNRQTTTPGCRHAYDQVPVATLGNLTGSKSYLVFRYEFMMIAGLGLTLMLFHCRWHCIAFSASRFNVIATCKGVFPSEKSSKALECIEVDSSRSALFKTALIVFGDTPAFFVISLYVSPFSDNAMIQASAFHSMSPIQL